MDMGLPTCVALRRVMVRNVVAKLTKLLNLHLCNTSQQQ